MNRLPPMLLVLVLAACGSTEPSVQQVQVSGTITSGGQPVTENAFVALGVTGRTDPVSSSVGFLDGTYGIAGEVESSDCGSLFVSVFLQNPFGQVILGATEPLDSCGTHVVDLVLIPVIRAAS